MGASGFRRGGTNILNWTPPPPPTRSKKKILTLKKVLISRRKKLTWKKHVLQLFINKVLDTKGEGVVSPSHGGNFFGFWGTKTSFFVRYKVKINLNSSSQCNNDCSIRGGRGGGDRFCC